MGFLKSLFFALVVAVLVVACAVAKKPENLSPRGFQYRGFAQGTSYSIRYFAADSILNQAGIDSIFSVLDHSLSIYQPQSLINALNNSTQGIEGDSHLRNVLQKAVAVARNTKGIFDVTVYPFLEAWGFEKVKVSSPPPGVMLDSIKTCVGSHLLRIEKGFIHKQKPCVKIDVDGIAQGYSVDVFAGFLEDQGIKNYFVEIGGEVRASGKNISEKRSWNIAIENPKQAETSDNSAFQAIIALKNGALTTSGSYRKYVKLGGKKYMHIIDPRTGAPSQSNIISVTVWAKDAMTADAYDNALLAMGLKSAMQFLKKEKNLKAYFIYQDQNGAVKDTATTSFIKTFLQKRSN